MSGSNGTVIADLEKNATERVRVTLTEYNGRNLCDIRVYTEYKSSGEVGPTKKGVSLRVEMLPALIAALTEAHGKAVASGGGGGGR